MIYTWLEQVGERESKLVYGWMERWTCEQVSGQVGEQVDGQVSECVNGWLRRVKDDRING